MDFERLTATELQKKLKNREISAVETAELFIQRIEADRNRSDTLNAFIHFCPDDMLKAAEAADQRIADNDTAPLLGIPVAIKDNINWHGKPTTCGSKMLEGYRASYDAHVIEQLKSAGAVFPGKTNMDEFAMGSSNETSAFGPVRNPVSRDRIPGGSSGGSAAAVAAGFAPLALGSDTGGSIRQPAALCGVVGFKPTYGLISRYGLVAFASSLDQIGTFSTTVADTALLMNTLAGHDLRDSTSVSLPVPDYTAGLDGDLDGITVGIPEEYYQAGLSPEINSIINRLITLLEKNGAKIKPISLPSTEYAAPVYYIIAPAEASANLARFDGIRYGHRSKAAASLSEVYNKSRGEGFGDEVKRRILLGTYVLSSGYYDAYYKKAQQVRTVIRDDFRRGFDQCDIMLTPTTPTTAFPLGSKLDDPVAMYLSDIYTISANLAGIPGLSLPAGTASDGLPVGVQLLGAHFEEAKLLQISHRLEQLIQNTQ